MTENENFWDASIFNIGDAIETPKSILDDQAKGLMSLTNGLLMPIIGTQSNDDEFIYSLIIKAPRLGNITVEILRVQQSIFMFPCYVDSKFTPNHAIKCDTMSEYKRTLKWFLAESNIKEVIRAIYLQAASVQ